MLYIKEAITMKILKIALFTVLLLSIFMLTASAKTIDVGVGYPYSNVASGVAASVSGDTVYIHAGTFNMGSGAVELKSNTILHGDSAGKTILYYSATTGGVESSDYFQGGLEGSSVSNIEIYGLTFTSNCPDETSTGHGDSRSLIRVVSCTGVNIHDCVVNKYVYSDFVTCQASSNVNVFNCSGQCGHDFVQGIKTSTNVRVFNCNISIADNSGVRSDYGINSLVDHNTFTNVQGGGFTCFEAEDAIVNNTMTKCVFHDLSNSVSAAGNSKTSGPLAVTDNRGWNCGTVGYGTSTLNQFSVTNHDLNYWILQGYGAGSSADGGGTPAVVYNGAVLPTLISPANGSNVNTINNNITYSWSDVNSTSYRIYISNNSGFTSLLYSLVVSSPSTSLVSSPGTYYWRVSAHDDVHNSWTANTTTFYHVVVGNTLATTGCYGEVFDTDKNTPIKGAVVSLMNGTWSNTLVTGADGAYSFSVTPSTGLYWIMASATGYQTIPESPGLPLNMTGDYVQEDIALTKSPSYFEPHYVSFRVVDANTSNIFSPGSLLQGADIQFFAQGNDPLNGASDIEVQTGSDGIATVGISQNVNYTVITTYGVVEDTEYITPVSSGYTIYLSIPSASIAVTPFTQATNLTLTQNVINATSAYINVTYNDSTNTSTGVVFSVGQMNNSNTFNMLNITGVQDTWAQAQMVNGVANDSWIVTTYMGQSYVVQANITSSTYGSVIETKTTTFPPNNLPFQGTFEFSMGCILLTLISLTMFGKWDADKALVICPLMFLVECTIGGYDGLNIYIPGASSSAMIFGTLALCYGILNYMTSPR